MTKKFLCFRCEHEVSRRRVSPGYFAACLSCDEDLFRCEVKEESRQPRLTIYHGAPRPIVARGEHQCRILGFAHETRCWHYMGTDRAELRAIKALAARGCLEISGDTYRFTYPRGQA